MWHPSDSSGFRIIQVFHGAGQWKGNLGHSSNVLRKKKQEYAFIKIVCLRYEHFFAAKERRVLEKGRHKNVINEVEEDHPRGNRKVNNNGEKQGSS